MWGRRFIAIFCLLCYSEGAGRFLQVAMLSFGSTKARGGDSMTGYEVISTIVMIITLVIAAYKLGKDSK